MTMATGNRRNTKRERRMSIGVISDPVGASINELVTWEEEMKDIHNRMR